VFSAKGDLGEGLFVQRRLSVHLRGQGGGEGWGISQSFSSDRIYLRLCQAPCPVMNLNDPDPRIVSSTVPFFCVPYNWLELGTRWLLSLAEKLFR